MTNDMGKKLHELRDARGLTQREVANAVGVTEATVSRWESGHINNMRRDKIESLAKVLQVSPLVIMGRTEELTPHRETALKHPAANSYVHIPVLGAIPAGIPSEAIESVLDYEDIPADMAKHGNFYGLIARGHSMEPTINDGDVVIIRQQPTVESGEIAVVKLNGNEATLKEVKITDEGIFIIGHNRSAFEPMFLTHEQAKSLPLRILGKAVELRRTLGK